VIYAEATEALQGGRQAGGSVPLARAQRLEERFLRAYDIELQEWIDATKAHRCGQPVMNRRR
jgi:hypothetical protein